jgi:hypothetical protein
MQLDPTSIARHARSGANGGIGARVSGLPSDLQRAPICAASSHLTSTITIARTHLSLDKDCPEQRPIQVPKVGKISPSPKSVVCTVATSASRRDSSHSPLMPPQRTGATSSTHSLIETCLSDSAGSSDRYRSQLLPHATSRTIVAFAPAQISVQIEFSAGTGFDRETPRIGKPLMRVPSLAFYYHAMSPRK